MFDKFFRNLGMGGKKDAQERQTANMVGNMGGSLDRLSQKERRRLSDLAHHSAKIQSMEGGEQMKAFLDNMDNELEQVSLLRKAGAFERSKQKYDDAIKANREVFRTGFTLPPSLQKMLEDVPVAPLRDRLRDTLREVLYFNPVMPPAEQTGLSFFGGLPMAPKGLTWPRYTDHKDQQRPAHFIGQIDCAEIPDFGLRHLYPEDGILFFFYPMDREGHRDIIGDLVVHLPKTDDITQSVPPASLVSYTPKHASYRKFWLHELDHPHLPEGSILPKWEMKMDVGVQLHFDAVYYEEEFELSPNDDQALEEACDCNDKRFTIDFIERMEKDPAISCLKGAKTDYDPRLKADDGFSIGFPGFPHNFHSMHTMLGGYCALLDDAEETLMQYIRHVDGDPAYIFCKGDWNEPEHHQTRKQHCLGSIDAIAKRRQEIDAVMQDLGPDVLAVPTTEKDRQAFWDLWRNLSSDGELKLEYHMSDQWAPFLNHANKMNPIVEDAARHCILASACNGPESFQTLPEDVARQWVERHQNSHAHQGFRHQSLGYTPRTQGSEGENCLNIGLMQFPDAEFRDFALADLGALQYWIDLPALKRQDFSSIRATVGN